MRPRGAGPLARGYGVTQMDASEIAVWAQRFPDAFPRDDTAEDARTRRRLISEAIATDAGPERLRRIAEALGKAQRYHAAASCFHMLHEIAPADLLVLRDLANTLLKARRYAEAVRPLREVADEKAFAKTQFAALNLGRCLIGLGRPEEAIEALQQALALKRDYHATHSALARAYLIVGDEERLATHIGVAREAKPDDLEVRLVSAAWRALSGEPAEAADVLADLAPRFVEARTLQTLLLQIGDTAPVALHVRKSVASYRTVYVDMLRFFAQFPPRAQARLLSWVRATLDDDLMASWLAGLERHDPNTLDESTCASIAGALAADGEFEAARRWMGRAPAATHRRTPLAIVSDRQSLAGPPLTASDTRNCFRTFLLRDCKQLDDAERWTGRPFEEIGRAHV